MQSVGRRSMTASDSLWPAVSCGKSARDVGSGPKVAYHDNLLELFRTDESITILVVEAERLAEALPLQPLHHLREFII